MPIAGMGFYFTEAGKGPKQATTILKLLSLILTMWNQISAMRASLKKWENPLKPKKYYIVALKANPEDPRPHLFYARLLAEHGFIHGASVHFRYALKLSPGDVEAHCEYARLLARFGHRHEAEVQYKKALELNPEHFGTLHGYADLLKKKGQYAEAEEIHRQAEFFKRSAW
jgi:tetratricopeptide (TPR) repeat protein